MQRDEWLRRRAVYDMKSCAVERGTQWVSEYEQAINGRMGSQLWRVMALFQQQ